MNTVNALSQAKASSGLHTALSWLVTLLLPVVLTLTAVRMLFTPLFLQMEYSMPGFPPDWYGFTKVDRLYWSNIAMQYLLNDAGIEYLGDLRFADGRPVYNERELHHMVDVKNAIQTTLNVWMIALGALIVLAAWAYWGGWRRAYARGLWRGGWLTAGLIAAILLLVAAAFGMFFVAFHNVFFQPGTWTFLYSDTLIRLFPERFWRDIFVYVGGLTLIAALVIVWLTKKKI